MSSIFPIGVEDLLSGQTVETARLELKESWNADNTGPQVLQTLCAFANDLQNLNGGYILIGVAEQAGVAQRPVRGLAPEQIDAAQKWIRGHCNRIEATYMPIFSPEDVDGKKILVLWAPPSDLRPHQAPDSRNGKPAYWVRIGSETTKAQGPLLDQLMQLTARVPFDDRRASDARLEDLREGRVREFLRDVHSALVDEPDRRQVYRHARLSCQINDHEIPRNIALLFFTDNPEQWFPGARIEVAQFADDAAGNILEEKTFRGPAHEQIRQCLHYLENFATHHLEKVRDRAETRGWVSYPSPALRETIVNALYHRSYDGTLEPTKVYLYPNRIEVISYPGPVPGIDLEQLNRGRVSSPVPARNRRIGELLKELRLAEGRNTGVSKIFRSMEDNGSPPPKFDFDPTLSYFRVTLPAHPEYIAIAALRDAAYLKATGDEPRALARIREAWEAHPTSALLAASLIREYAERQDLEAARGVHDRSAEAKVPGYAGVATAMADAYLDAGRRMDALTMLDRLPAVLSPVEAFDAAILERRVKREKRAHGYFQQAGEAILNDVRALHEFAQCKIRLTADLVRPPHNPQKRDARLRLLREAEELLERVVQLDAPPTRHAWAWYDLGRARRWLRKPASDVDAAFDRAADVNPGDPALARELSKNRHR